MMGLVGCTLTFLAIRELEDLTPDAVTGATGYSPRTGELASLVDGHYPGQGEAPDAFTWLVGGILTFTFEQTVRVQEVRLYIGADAGWYVLTVYSSEGETTVSVADSSGRVNGWVILRLSEPRATRFLKLSIQGKTTLYEVQIWGQRAVCPMSWGMLKAMFKGEP